MDNFPVCQTPCVANWDTDCLATSTLLFDKSVLTGLFYLEKSVYLFRNKHERRCIERKSKS